MSIDDITPTPPADEAAASRRWFLGAAAAVAAGGLLAACGDNDDPAVGSGPVTTAGGAATTATTAASATSDADVAKLAASLEVLAVGTYKAGLDAAKANKLGTVPPAVATFATTAMNQHQQALDAWNKVLTSSGGQAVSMPPASLKATVDQQFAQVTDVTGLANLALLLERTAADTYLSATQTLKGKEALTMAGAIQSVDQEHIAILLFVLGMYPVPDVFQRTDKAFKG